MIKIENIQTYGWEPAIRGMRNPKNSWHLSDSKWTNSPSSSDIIVNFSGDSYYVIGEKDQNLAMRLRNAGSVHRKFMRMIHASMDVTASHTWWAEFDTYKVSTVRNSCSKMHKIHVKEFVKDDFDHEGIDEVGGSATEIFTSLIDVLEHLRKRFNETNEKKYWRAMIELLPVGYRIKATVELNYETLLNIFKPDSRQWHKLDEWCRHDKKIEGRDYFTDFGFCDIILVLPFSRLITGEE